jgi:hypothetical protein
MQIIQLDLVLLLLQLEILTDFLEVVFFGFELFDFLNEVHTFVL